MADDLDDLLKCMEDDDLDEIVTELTQHADAPSSTAGTVPSGDTHTTKAQSSRESCSQDQNNTAYFSTADGDFSWLNDSGNGQKDESTELNKTLSAAPVLPGVLQPQTATSSPSLEDELKKLEARQTEIRRLLSKKTECTQPSINQPSSAQPQCSDKTTVTVYKSTEVNIFANHIEHPPVPAPSTSGEKSLVHAGDSSDSEDEIDRNTDDLRQRQSMVQVRSLRKQLTAATSLASSSTAGSSSSTAASDSHRFVKPTTSAAASIRKRPVITGTKHLLSTSLKHQGATPAANKKDTTVVAAFDSFFGIKIRTPAISSSTLESLCEGRQKRKLSALNVCSAAQQQAQWVTMGVIAEKTNTKSSAKGTQYSMWKVTDLSDDSCPPTLLWVFGDALKKHWKIGVGVAIVVFDAAFMDDAKDGGKPSKGKEVKIKVFNANQIMELGYCPDFGYCKGRRKADNQSCTNVVNRSLCGYCQFHLLSASKTLAAKRGELQYSGNAPPKSFEKRILGDKSQIMYGGRAIGGAASTTSGARQKPPPLTMEQVRTNRGISKVLSDTRKLIIQREGGVLKEQDVNPLQHQPKTDSAANPLEKLLEVPSFGSRNLLRQLSAACSTADRNATKGRAASFKDVLASAPPPPAALPTLQAVRGPKLGRGFAGRAVGGTLSLGNTPDMQALAAMDRAKQRAAAVIKKTGVSGPVKEKVKKRDRTAESPSKPSASSSCSDGSAGNATGSQRGDTSPIKKRTKLGEVDLNDDRIRALLDKKSSHDNEVDEEEAKQEDKYFSMMGAKEQVENRLTSLMELKDCKVVSCKKCAYTNHAQSDLCKQQGHVIQRHTATKKFFKCKQCAKRTVAYSQMPTRPCTQCNSSEYVAVAMKDQRKGPQLTQEELKLRGDEIKFLNR